jgi:hypothetical protein
MSSSFASSQVSTNSMALSLMYNPLILFYDEPNTIRGKKM